MIAEHASGSALRSRTPGTPSAPLRDLIAHRELIENLVLRDIKSRYKQSTLGIAWAILNPLVMAMIFSVVGALFLKQALPIHFAVFTYFGLLFWNLFSMGVLGATDSLVAHLSLITKVYFPREVFPVATVVGKLVDFGFGLLGLIPLLLVFKVAPSPLGLLLIVPLALLQVVFTMGLGMLFACANLFNRDVRHIAGLLIAVWMYLVPNLYPLETVPEGYRRLYLANPIATIIDTARKLAFPQLVHGEATIHWPWLGVACVTSLAMFAASYVIFKRYEAGFAESV